LERHLAEGVVAEFFAFFANFTTVGHTHQAKKVAMMNPS